MRPLFEAILEHVPPPPAIPKPLQFQISALDYSSYIGQIGIGRIGRGRLKAGQQVLIFGADGKSQPASVTQVYGFEGLERVPQETPRPGTSCCCKGSRVSPSAAR